MGHSARWAVDLGTRLDSFCFQVDLLSLQTHQLGRDALERRFFGDIDDKGAIARDSCWRKERTRCRPSIGSNLHGCSAIARSATTQTAQTIRGHERPIRERLDSDPEVLEAAAEAGLTEKPSEYFERWTGVTMHDRLFAGLIQKLTDNAEVGGRLVAAHWTLKRLNDGEGSFVLGDRPLVRIYGYGRPDASIRTIYQLTPQTAFVAVNDIGNLNRSEKASSGKFLRWLQIH